MESVQTSQRNVNSVKSLSKGNRYKNCNDIIFRLLRGYVGSWNISPAFIYVLAILSQMLNHKKKECSKFRCVCDEVVSHYTNVYCIWLGTAHC